MYVQDATANFMFFNTTSGPILRCRGWTLAGAPCTLIKACQNGVIIPGGLQNTNRTEVGNSASGSGGSETLPRRDDGVPNPPPLNDWTAPGSSIGCKSSLGTGTVLLSGNFSINSISTFNINNSSWRRRRRILGKCFPKKTDPLGTGGVWTRERIGLVCNRPSPALSQIQKV